MYRVMVRLLTANMVFLFFLPFSARAQNTTPPQSPEVQAIEDKLAILEAQQKIFNAYLPNLPSAPEGTPSTGEEAPVESQILAYEVLEDIATELASKINCGGGKLVIYDKSSLDSIIDLQAFRNQMALLRKTLEKATSGSGDDRATASAAIAPAISFGLGLSQLFRPTVAVQSSSFDTDDTALAAIVASYLKTCEVWMPAVYPPNLLKADSGIWQEVDKLRELAEQLQDAVAEKEKRKQQKSNEDAQAATELASQKKALEMKQKELAKAEEEGKPTDAVKQEVEEIQEKIQGLESKRKLLKIEIDTLKEAITKLGSYIELYTEFRKALLASEGNSGLSLISRLLRIEKLSKIMGEDAQTLYLKTVALGGTAKASRNFFRDSLKHSGGAIVNYIHFEPDGKPKASGVIAKRGKFRKFKNWP